MSRGPIPKRSEERTRKSTKGEDGIELRRGAAHPYTWTDPSFDWANPIQRYYNSFRNSGMAAYYQQTDVETLWLACEWMNRQYESGRPSAMILGEVRQMTDGLGATEGERRRLKIELEASEEKDTDAEVVALHSAESRLRSSANK